MQIGTLLTHDRDPSDNESTRAQHSQAYSCSHVSFSSGEGSPGDESPRTSPNRPEATTLMQDFLKREPHDSDIDVIHNAYILARHHGLKRPSPEADDDEDHATAASTMTAMTPPGKKVPRLSSDARPTTEQHVVHEFACPFYKRNRGKYCHQRSCRTSGWPSVHRVKEHLYRHHMHYVCDRCSETFKIQDHLRAHLRQETACRVSPRSVAEDAGFDAEIEKRLRSRKKIEGQNEVDKWNHMFRILFPSFSAKPTPHPFVEYSLSLQDDLGAQAAKHEAERVERAERADSGLHMMATAAMARHETESGSYSPATLTHGTDTAGSPPTLAASTPRAEFHSVYAHDGPEGAPPAFGYRSNTDPQVLSRDDMYQMVQQHVWKVLTQIPGSPMAPVPHRH